jgi:Mg-chelatase subunit ChlD
LLEARTELSAACDYRLKADGEENTVTQPTDQTASSANPPSESTTHLVVVIDASGSMAPLQGFVIEGANTLLADIDPSVRVTLIQFDSRDHQVVMVDEVPAGEVAPLTVADYQPNAGTPLYDAVGTAVGSTIGQAALYEALTGNKAGVVFAIISDGQENASTRYSATDMRRLLERQQEAGWTVQFLGLGIDAFAEGAHLGIDAAHTVASRHDRGGTLNSFAFVSQAVGRRQARLSCPGSSSPNSETGTASASQR